MTDSDVNEKTLRGQTVINNRCTVVDKDVTADRKVTCHINPIKVKVPVRQIGEL